MLAVALGGGRYSRLVADGRATALADEIVGICRRTLPPLSGAILHGSLAPEGRLSFARADQWSDWAITTLYNDLILTCFVGMIFKSKPERDNAGIRAAAKRVGANLALLDAQLEGKSFILGDKLTFADILVGAYMYRYFNIDIERPRNVNVVAWYQRLTSRPAYQQHVMIDFSGMKVTGA